VGWFSWKVFVGGLLAGVIFGGLPGAVLMFTRQVRSLPLELALLSGAWLAIFVNQ